MYFQITQISFVYLKFAFESSKGNIKITHQTRSKKTPTPMKNLFCQKNCSQTLKKVFVMAEKYLRMNKTVMAIDYLIVENSYSSVIFLSRFLRSGTSHNIFEPTKYLLAPTSRATFVHLLIIISCLFLFNYE